MARFGMALDYKNCINCKACETACKEENGILKGADKHRIWVGTAEIKGESSRLVGRISCFSQFRHSCFRVAQPKNATGQGDTRPPRQPLGAVILFSPDPRLPMTHAKV